MGQVSNSWLALSEFSPYLLLLVLLTVGIWLVPFAEEIALATAGYWYYTGEVGLAPVLCVTIAGVFLGDALAFWVGRRWNGAWFPRFLPFPGDGRWLEVVGPCVDRYGPRALFWARFLPGVRLPAHVLVGMHGMSITTYGEVSLLSVAVYVPVVVSVASLFGEEIDTALASLKALGNVAWGFFFIAISLWIVVRFWTSRLRMARRRHMAS